MFQKKMIEKRTEKEENKEKLDDKFWIEKRKKEWWEEKDSKMVGKYETGIWNECERLKLREFSQRVKYKRLFGE